jgi:hypothetical protein
MAQTTFQADSAGVKITSTPQTKTKAVITSQMIDALVTAQTAKSEAAKASDKAEKEFDKQLVNLFDNLFGIKTKAEIVKLTPAEIKARFEAGYGKDFKLEKGLNFIIEKSKEGRYPAWKELFIKHTSEAVANQVTQDAPVQYSYKIKKVGKG